MRRTPGPSGRGPVRDMCGTVGSMPSSAAEHVARRRNRLAAVGLRRLLQSGRVSRPGRTRRARPIGRINRTHGNRMARRPGGSPGRRRPPERTTRRRADPRQPLPPPRGGKPESQERGPENHQRGRFRNRGIADGDRRVVRRRSSGIQIDGGDSHAIGPGADRLRGRRGDPVQVGGVAGRRHRHPAAAAAAARQQPDLDRDEHKRTTAVHGQVGVVPARVVRTRENKRSAGVDDRGET